MYFFITLTYKDGKAYFVANSSAENYIDYTEMSKFALRIHKDRLGEVLKLATEQADDKRGLIFICAGTWFKDIKPTKTWEPKEI